MFFSKYYMPTVDIKCYNASINKDMFFDVPIKNKEEVCGKDIKVSKNNDYTTDNLLDFFYISKN